MLNFSACSYNLQILYLQIINSDKKNFTPNIQTNKKHKFILKTNPSIFTERNHQCGNQHHSRELLMIGIAMSETCWAYKKYNKIISDIKLVSYSSVITMMHGPTNIRPTNHLQYDSKLIYFTKQNNVLSLSLQRAFCSLFKQHTNKCPYIVFNNLKFTLKHLKLSYMFRSHDHPQAAYFVLC